MDEKQLIVFTKHFQGLSVEELIQTMHSAGSRGADLCVRDTYPVNPDNIKSALPEAVKQFRNAGLDIPMVTTPGDFTEPSQQAESFIAACGDAGIGLIKLGYWKMDEQGYWKNVEIIRKKLSEFTLMAEKYNTRVMIHNHSGATMGLNACSAMNLVKDFDPRYVGVFADPGHLSLVGEPLPMALDIVKDYLSAIAVKDMVREKILADKKRTWQLKMVPLGEGYVDWHTLAELVEQIKFEGPISIHSEYDQLGIEDLTDQTRMDIRFFKRLF